jgi:hypothetical protein
MDDSPPLQHTRVLTPTSATNFGDIKDRNIEHRLGEITMPTLLTPAHGKAFRTVQVVYDNMPGSEAAHHRRDRALPEGERDRFDVS